MLEFDPLYWNTKGLLSNCYTYATNCRYDGSQLSLGESYKRMAAKIAANQMPGCLSGRIGFHETRDIEKYIGMDGAILVPHRGQLIPRAPRGFYLIAAMLGTAALKSKAPIHFLRQDSDGSWSHKCGRWPISQVDDHKEIIENPLTANFDHYLGKEKSYAEFFALPDPGWADAYPAWRGLKEVEDMKRRFNPLAHIQS